MANTEIQLTAILAAFKLVNQLPIVFYLAADHHALHVHMQLLRLELKCLLHKQEKAFCQAGIETIHLEVEHDYYT